MALGNPAPLGLLAFGMTTLMLMYVEMGWVEKDTEGLLVGYAFFYGGVGQVLVAIFEIMKGSSFSFAVFGSYGFFWLGWAYDFLEMHRDYSDLGDFSFKKGKAAMFIQWGILSLCFWTITLRKNIALISIFALLSSTFFLLAIGVARDNHDILKVAGYVGFLTALGAFYTGIAELVNEEWGRNILPGLTPIHRPERLPVTKESIKQLISYDVRSNTLLLHFRGLQISTSEAVEAIKQAVESSILEANELKAKTASSSKSSRHLFDDMQKGKVHVVADYQNVVIAKPIENEYWAMARRLEKDYYLSARRFSVTSFGTRNAGPAMPQTAVSIDA